MAVKFSDFAGTVMRTQNVNIALTSAACEAPASYATWVGVAANTERSYLIGASALPATHTTAAPNLVGNSDCVTYMSSAIPAALSTFATFTPATGILSWTMITDETKYGLHQIPVTAETTGGVSFGAATNLAMYMSKPACEPGSYTISSAAPMPAVSS